MDEHPRGELYSDEETRAGAIAAADSDTEEVDTPELEQQRAEVEQTRAAVSETIEAIRERLSPHHLVEQAKETVREATVGRAQEAVSNAVDTAKQAVSNVGEAVSNVGETVRDTGSSILDTIRDNPVPAAMIAIGLGWLFMSSRQRAEQEARRARQRTYYDPNAPRARYSPGYQSAATAYSPAGTAPVEGEGIGDKVDRVREKAGEIADRTQQVVGDFVDRAQDAASRFVDRAQGVAGSAADSAREVAGTVTEAARTAGSTVWECIQENPIPAAVTAFSLAWFLTSVTRSGSRDGDYERWARQDRDRWEGRSVSDRIAQWNRELSGAGAEAGPDDVYYRTGYRSHRTGPETNGSYSRGGSGGIASVGQQIQRSVGRVGDQFQDWVQRSPATAGAAAITLGAVAGLLIPETRREHELMGEARDTLVEKAQQTAQELGEKAQTVAQQVIEQTGDSSGAPGNGGQRPSGQARPPAPTHSAGNETP